MAPHRPLLRQLWLDVGLARQGIELGWDFGLQALAEMGRVAELVEHAVYAEGSLGRLPSDAPWRLGFALRGPPLRVGAFSSIRLFWDGQEADPGRAAVRVIGQAPWRTLAALQPDAPVCLPVGERIEFAFDPPGAESPGEHTVRLELRSVAIPPRVWFEFTDSLKA